MTCYLRNGTASPKSAPCDHNALLQGHHTGCCNPGDLCLTNGLCRNPNVNDLTNYAWFFGCTDKTFTDPACGNYCDKIDNNDAHQLSFQCPESNTWCCNKGDVPRQAERVNRTNTACCSVTELLFKAPAPSVYATASYATLSGISFSIATLAPSSRPTGGALTDSSSTAHSTSSSTLAVGLGAGLGGGAVVAIALGLLLVRRRKRMRAEKALPELSNDDQPRLTKQDYGQRAGHELEGSGAQFELNDRDGLFELQGEGGRSELQDKGGPIEKMGHMEAVELPATPDGK